MAQLRIKKRNKSGILESHLLVGELDNGNIYIELDDNKDFCAKILTKKEAEKLRDHLIEQLK